MAQGTFRRLTIGSRLWTVTLPSLMLSPHTSFIISTQSSLIKRPPGSVITMARRILTMSHGQLLELHYLPILSNQIIHDAYVISEQKRVRSDRSQSITRTLLKLPCSLEWTRETKQNSLTNSSGDSNQIHEQNLNFETPKQLRKLSDGQILLTNGIIEKEIINTAMAPSHSNVVYQDDNREESMQLDVLQTTSIHIDAFKTKSSPAKLTKLTDAERAHLRSLDACFKCRRQGHMARECPIKAKPQSGNMKRQ